MVFIWEIGAKFKVPASSRLILRPRYTYVLQILRDQKQDYFFSGIDPPFPKKRCKETSRVWCRGVKPGIEDKTFRTSFSVYFVSKIERVKTNIKLTLHEAQIRFLMSYSWECEADT